MPPVGWRLREQASERWLRIHGLPGSKRYPETAAERAEIHHRHEALAAELFAASEGACWVVVPAWGAANEAGPQLPGLADLRFAIGWRPGHASEDEPTFAHVAPARWSAPATRAARELVIEDSLRVLWVARETLEVFAPYDGGVDVIAADLVRRDALAQRFGSWRSPRPDGL